MGWDLLKKKTRNTTQDEHIYRNYLTPLSWISCIRNICLTSTI